MRKGDATRERLLEIAEAAVLAKGFGATSIEELIAEAGITKSGFFYHFKDKNELALGLLRRHEAQTRQLLDDSFGRAGQLSDDPLQAFLIGLTLLAEINAAIPGGHPGCMVASMSYQDRIFDRNVRTEIKRIAESWSQYVYDKVAAIAAAYPPREPVDLDQLSLMICCTIDGGIIMAKSLGQPDILPRQILVLRDHVKALFGAGAGVRLHREAVAA